MPRLGSRSTSQDNCESDADKSTGSKGDGDGLKRRSPDAQRGFVDEILGLDTRVLDGASRRVLAVFDCVGHRGRHGGLDASGLLPEVFELGAGRLRGPRHSVLYRHGFFWRLFSSLLLLGKWFHSWITFLRHMWHQKVNINIGLETASTKTHARLFLRATRVPILAHEIVKKHIRALPHA